MNIRNKTILIISPHPDDEAIGCGGLIAKAKGNKSDVFVLYICVGSSRQFVTGKTSAADRLPEIKHAAQFGNFKYKIAYQGKAFMRLDTIPQKDLIEIIEDVTEKVKPEIVCLPFRHSYDQDHRAVATAAITAYRTLPRTIRHQPKMILEYEEPYTWTTDTLFHPNMYLDISDIFNEKMKLLNCHASQMRRDPFSRSPENLERLAGIRGCEIGTKYAESYRILRGIAT